jgi:hypothetical protein
MNQQRLARQIRVKCHYLHIIHFASVYNSNPLASIVYVTADLG